MYDYPINQKKANTPVRVVVWPCSKEGGSTLHPVLLLRNNLARHYYPQRGISLVRVLHSIEF